MHELPITYHPAMLFGPAVRSAKPHFSGKDHAVQQRRHTKHKMTFAIDRSSRAFSGSGSARVGDIAQRVHGRDRTSNSYATESGFKLTEIDRR
jgi:hypothetical protein